MRVSRPGEPLECRPAPLLPPVGGGGQENTQAHMIYKRQYLTCTTYTPGYNICSLMLAPNLSPVHFWRQDPDAIELKLENLQDLRLAEYVLNAADAEDYCSILSLSPIKNRAVLNLMQRFKKSRGVPGTVASAKRKMQSLQIAQALDDLTCIAETPTRLSICRNGSVCNVPSPASPVRPQSTPLPQPADPELKYLFEVLGAATPYMNTPPPCASQCKSKPVVRLCAVDKDDLLGLSRASQDTLRETAQSARQTGIPTPRRSAANRSTSAPPKRTPARTPVGSGAVSRRAATPKAETPVLARARSQSPAAPKAARTPTRTAVPATPRSAFKKNVELAAPIRTARKSPEPAAVRTPRSTIPTRAATKATTKSTPSYLQPTKNSIASRSKSPNGNRMNEMKSPVSPSRAGADASRSPSTKPRPAMSPAARRTPAAEMKTPEKNIIIDEENISPNITTRSSRRSSKKQLSPPMSQLRTPKTDSKSRRGERSSIGKLMAEREKDSDFFNSVMASCDDILAQLDAAVSKGPKVVAKV